MKRIGLVLVCSPLDCSNAVKVNGAIGIVEKDNLDANFAASGIGAKLERGIGYTSF